MKNKIRNVVCTNNGDWYDIEDCTVLFDVDIDPITNDPIPNYRTRAELLEKITFLAIKQLISEKSITIYRR